MRLTKVIAVEDLIQKYGLELISDDTDGIIRGINEIHSVRSGDITFVDVAKYYKKAIESEASFILINTKDIKAEGKCLLYTDNPFLVYNQFAKDQAPTKHSINKMIADDCIIGEGTIIYPNVYIGDNVVIGSNCIIYANTTIYPNTIIGDEVIIQSNSAIGSEAFYYNKQNGKYLKMHTVGKTVIENRVEIGSNCSIDACESDETRIGEGTKLDNNIHIAHGVKIGKNCLLCAQVAIAGKTFIGDHVILYGKVGVSKGLKIGDNAIILASSNVDKDLEGGQRYYGSPAIEARQAMKHYAAARMLPDVLYKLKDILYPDKVYKN